MSGIAVAVYARISRDLDDTQLGVDRQVADCEAIARVRSWEVAERYVDNDFSAFNRKVVRPRFEQMLLDLRAGKIDGIVVYDLDRLVRQPRDLERVIDTYEDRKALVYGSVTADLNLQSSDGRTMARVMVAFANKSSADTGRRTARKHLELAQEGKPVGGRRPFGWQQDKATLHPAEAQAGRELIDSIIAGQSVRSAVMDLRAKGFTSTAGSEWSFQAARKWLRNPRLVGWRVHQGVVLHDEHGKPVNGLWEPLVGLDTWERLQQTFKPDNLGAKRGRKGARRYLLTGIVRCGVCNGTMWGNALPRGGHNYSCVTNEGGKHTNTISGAQLDGRMTELVLRSLEAERLESARPAATWGGELELDETLGKIERLRDWLLAGRISEETGLSELQRLEDQRDRMRNDRAQWIVETTGPVVRDITPLVWGESLSMDQRREVIAVRYPVVRIQPITQRSGNRVDWARVKPLRPEQVG